MLTGDTHETEDAHARLGSDAATAVGAGLQTGCCKHKSVECQAMQCQGHPTGKRVKDGVQQLRTLGAVRALVSGRAHTDVTRDASSSVHTTHRAVLLIYNKNVGPSRTMHSVYLYMHVYRY